MTDDLRAESLRILEAAWRPSGFCVPNGATYPWQWLWDSCFHAIAWAELGRPDRAVTELATSMAGQAADGFVPHLTYHDDPHVHAELWGRVGTSCITQPPMHAHALAELVRRGIAVPIELIERSERALLHLLEVRPRHRSGLVAVLHPWETGCDDSPRWDGWGCADRATWWERKGEMVTGLVMDPEHGTPRTNPTFEVGSAGFTALVAHGALELASILEMLDLVGDEGGSQRSDSATTASPEPDPPGTGHRRAAVQSASARSSSWWREQGAALAAQLDDRWDPSARTWADAGPDGPISTRTLDALLGLLVTQRADAAAAIAVDLLDDRAYGGAAGPAGVHRAEASFDPHRYWRGAAWPQLTYLLWVAASQSGDAPLADGLAERLRRGAAASGFAEHWHPDTGAPGGAAPQTWTTLVALVTPRSE